jgi:quinoprotein glucose dehydrogenase
MLSKLRDEVSLTIHDDFELSLWASEKMLGDPIALDIDYWGRALVTVTNRSNNSEFDIRGVDNSWRIESMRWESVEDRREFLHTELAPERSDENTWIPDRNEDGSHDWRDLAVEKEEIWRIEDLTGNGLANQAQLFIKDFHDEVTDVAGAVLYYNDEVFLGVGPDMWRLRDTTGDGMADWKESISHGYNVHIGFSGHGMSGLRVGPDGRVYWGIGDMGLNVIDQEGNHWYYPNEGAILRSEPDGSNFEVFASGVRNTHEFDFDKHGNLITVDNDGDHPGEFERLVYLVNGSDSGWRLNWQFGKYDDPKNNDYKVLMDEQFYMPRFEDQAAYILPPLAEYHAGPTGFRYNPGTALGEEWKDHFFVVSFRGSPANSPIYAFTLEESGASFELATDQEILRGILPVGIDFGPDGALYMVDWIQGWGRNEQGRLWKMDVKENAESPIRVETRQLLEGDFSVLSVNELVILMGHDDMRVRQKAQFELVGRNADSDLLGAVEGSSHQLARIHGIWGLAQLGRQNIDTVEPLIGFLGDSDSEIRAQAAKMLGDVRYEPAGDDLIPLLEDENARVRFFATEALGRIGYMPAFDGIVNMLVDNNDEDVYLRHAGAIALERLGDGDAVTSLADHSSRAVRIAAVVALKRLEHPGAARFLEDDDEFVVTNAARAISDDAFIDEAMPALAEMLDQDRFVNEPLMRRAINASLYGGTRADAERLAVFSLRTDIEEAVRVEALETLASWPDPSIFDRVTGWYRGEFQNDPEYVREAIDPIAIQLLSDDNSEIRAAALGMIASVNYTGVNDQIFALINDDPSADVRIAALNALRDVEYDDVEAAITVALDDQTERVRMNALGMIQYLELPVENAVNLVENILETGTVEERQTALEVLSQFDDPASHAALEQQLDLLIADELIPEIQLDLVLAVEAANSERLNAKLAEYESTKDMSDPISQFREALHGGDIDEGRRIFYNDAAAQCIRCHAVGGRGADVGPDLADTGSVLTREQMLQSMVDPSARITPGYGSVTLTLDSGETIRGLLAAETETQITVTSGEDSWDIDKTEISERVNAPSGMPPMGNLLTRSQLRDLVEFMTTLEE